MDQAPGQIREIKFDLDPEQRKIKHLIKFTNLLKDEPFSYEGDVVAAKGSGSITVHGRVTWDRYQGECVLEADGHFGHHLMSVGSYGVLMPESEYVTLFAADGSWRSGKANVTRTNSGDGRERVTLRLFELETGEIAAATKSRGLIFAGADLADWPMFLPTDNDMQGGAADGMVTTIFGRDVLIRRMPSSTDAGRDVLVAFDGEPLEPLQQSALWLVMSFLAGHKANVVGEIGIEDEKEVRRERHMWTAPLNKAEQPLDAHRWNRAAFDLPKRFPDMVEKMLALIKEDIPVDVALTHLFANSRGHLDVEIRDITLALDTLVEAKAFEAKETTIIPPEQYVALLPEVEKALAEPLKDHPKGAEVLSRLIERLRGANDVSHGERRRKFWGRVGFGLKPDEKDALDNRHPMSHAGYVLRGADTLEYQALSDQVHLARTLVNRVILALIGYDGPVFDYTCGRTQPWQYFLDRDGSRKKKEPV
jgi:hypothetical protein